MGSGQFGDPSLEIFALAMLKLCFFPDRTRNDEQFFWSVRVD
jgi:hypothetical protein